MTTATAVSGRRSLAIASGLGLTAASVVLRGGFDVVAVVWLPVALVAAVALGVRRIDRRDGWFVASLALFATVWLVRGVIAGTASRSLSLSAFAVGFGCTYLLARMCAESERDAAMRWLTVVAAAVAVISLVGFVRHVEPWALSFDGVWRLAGPFAYPNAAGLFFAFGLVAITKPDRRAWPERVGLGSVIVAALVATMSRGAVLIACVGLVGRARRKTYVIVGAVGAALVVIALLLNNASVDDRVAEWAAALRQFRREPLFGAGPERDLLIHNFRGDAIARYAHNEVLQVGAGAGVVGLASLGLVVVAAVRLRRGQVVLAMLALGALVDFNWHFLGLATMAGWLVGLDEPEPTDRRLRNQSAAAASPSSCPADSSLE